MVKANYDDGAFCLNNAKKSEIKQWLNSFDTVITDCDGVLWLGPRVLPGSPDVINFFKSIGKRVYFLTNNSEKIRSEYAQKAQRLGYNIDATNILSSSYLAAAYLKERKFTKTAYVIGTSGITRELKMAGIDCIGVGPDVLQSSIDDMLHNEFTPHDDVGAVIVGYDEHFSIPKLTKACAYLDDAEVEFVATNSDEREPGKFIVPGPGAIIASIENCSGRQATIVGKPSPYVCEYILSKSNVTPERTLMIGDRCNTDILFGKNCNFQTLMVESGIHNRNDLEEFMSSDDEEIQRQVPDFYCKSLGSLLPFLK
ncbi:glycerol-3-phosphate phosphatase-like [Culicoides brevitarsis]|uniref:glycerol-3-phosphate phosphatase-like n=1 Tax=Culicoides brevitarsis TaxID=469753 RepID=UPI00307B98C4